MTSTPVRPQGLLPAFIEPQLTLAVDIAGIRTLIRRMANENPSWGEERIANELMLKLGIRVSPRTVRKYLPPRPLGRPRRNLLWSTFLRVHAQGIIACDFLVS